ncbi:MAG: T9SS type A sorting domain-containing protein [Bacteroidales bacterium]|nr:T9SS type A sorting domain-containing protein [Bacteroidales bacterium]
MNTQKHQWDILASVLFFTIPGPKMIWQFEELEYDYSMDVVVLGNFDVVSGQISAEYSKTGWWYEFFTGDSVNITNISDIITMQPGEYRIYTTKKLAKPDIIVSVNDLLYEEANDWINIYPNPVTDFMTINISEFNPDTEMHIDIITATGTPVYSDNSGTGGWHNTIDLSNINEGIYFLRITAGNRVGVKRFIKIK